MPIRMSHLAWVFIFKIVVTLLSWCIPFFFPDILALVGIPVPDPPMYGTLLGIAFLGLVVGYAVGLGQETRGIRPTGAVLAGIMSNGGSAAFLAFDSWRGSWSAWPDLAQALMTGSMLAAFLITMGLIWFGVVGWARGIANEKN
jgi:hypothetical protein